MTSVEDNWQVRAVKTESRRDEREAGGGPYSLLPRSDLEEELTRIQGVRTARVVGGDSPTEIHVVTEGDRPPKQVVRDVQSLATAGFGMKIDHRIVSVVQLDSAEAATRGEEANRPILERVVFATKGSSGWVKVALKWPDGEITEGTLTVGGTRDTRARAAVRALQQALEPALSKRNAAVDVDQVLIQRVGGNESVIVHAQYSAPGSTTPLVGSAIIHDDIATASVRALLHALNRKLS